MKNNFSEKSFSNRNSDQENNDVYSNNSSLSREKLYHAPKRISHFFDKNKRPSGIQLGRDMFIASDLSLSPKGPSKNSKQVKSSKGCKISIFGKSAILDVQLINDLSGILSNKVLVKEEEEDYFGEMNIFDQEWEFPFNKNHYEYHSLMENVEKNVIEVRVELFKRSLVELQIQLRTLSEYFELVNKERLFFRSQLVEVLQNKISSTVANSDNLKLFIKEHFGKSTRNYQQEIVMLKRENKDAHALFANLKRRNVALEEEIKHLNQNLNEKREELKKYRFRKDVGDDPNITRTTSGSNTQGFSGENSYASKDYIHKYTMNNKQSALNLEKKFKYSSTLSMPNSKNSMLMALKNRKLKSPKNSLMIKGNNEYFPADKKLPNFLQSSMNKYQQAFGKLSRKHRQTGNLNSTDSKDLSHFQNRRNGSKLDALADQNTIQKLLNSGISIDGTKGVLLNKSKKNLSSRLIQIKKRKSRNNISQHNMNPFVAAKVVFK